MIKEQDTRHHFWSAGKSLALGLVARLWWAIRVIRRRSIRTCRGNIRKMRHWPWVRRDIVVGRPPLSGRVRHKAMLAVTVGGLLLRWRARHKARLAVVMGGPPLRKRARHELRLTIAVE